MDTTQQICRFCLSEEHLLTNCTLDDDAIQAKISIIFSFRFDSHATLPSSICTSCYHKIDEYYEFTETVRQSQEQLTVREARMYPINMKFESTEAVLVEEPVVVEECVPIGYQTTPIKTEVDEPDEAQVESDESNQHIVQSQDEMVQFKIEVEDTGLQSAADPNVDRADKIAEGDQSIKEFFGLNCEICSEQFGTFSLLKIHTKETHEKVLSFTCCNKKYCKRYEILEHIDMHMNPHQFQCDSCGKAFTRRYDLENHRLLVHSSDEARPFKCDHCMRSYPRRHMLTSHMAKHDHNEVTCDVCNKVYKNRKSLRIHKSRVHTNAVYECDNCEQKFKQKVLLKYHYCGAS